MSLPENSKEKPKTDSVLTLLQTIIHEELEVTTKDVIKNLLFILVSSSEMDVVEFAKINIINKEYPIDELSERDLAFFKKMMEVITIELEKISSLNESFAVFPLLPNGETFEHALVGRLALPHIKKLIVTIDAIDGEAIGHIVEGDEKIV